MRCRPPIRAIGADRQTGLESGTEDSRSQTQRMQDLGIFSVIRTEIGQIIVADVNRERIVDLVRPEADSLAELIRKPIPQQA
jgi:hypothetical protein